MIQSLYLSDCACLGNGTSEAKSIMRQYRSKKVLIKQSTENRIHSLTYS